MLLILTKMYASNNPAIKALKQLMVMLTNAIILVPKKAIWIMWVAAKMIETRRIALCSLYFFFKNIRIIPQNATSSQTPGINMENTDQELGGRILGNSRI